MMLLKGEIRFLFGLGSAPRNAITHTPVGLAIYEKAVMATETRALSYILFSLRHALRHGVSG